MVKKGTIWSGEHYLRKETRDWRNRRTGMISSAPSGRAISRERTHSHIYGGDRFRVGSRILLPSKKKEYQFNEKAKKFTKRDYSPEIRSFEAI